MTRRHSGSRRAGPNARPPRDQTRDGRRAIHRSQHREIVARSDLAVCTPIALKDRLLLDGQNVLAARVLAKMIVARKFFNRAIVLVHPFARRDRAGGEANDLPELADWRAFPTGTTAIFRPFGTRWRATTPDGSDPAEMSSIAMITLSDGSRRRARGVVMIVVFGYEGCVTGRKVLAVASRDPRAARP